MVHRKAEPRVALELQEERGLLELGNGRLRLSRVMAAPGLVRPDAGRQVRLGRVGGLWTVAVVDRPCAVEQRQRLRQAA
ncbi:MAG TPA: hypothetical protein VKY89_24170 [Thermoanaerobaculia bacterium]|nr:hypothetical protein [Thermoanaerobaculia bacterium]